MISIAYKNILESGTVTLTAGTAHTDYPLYRLYDRNIGRIFKTTAAETTTIHIDQSATGNLAVDRLIIPTGHNLNGMTCDIEWSDNNTDWTAAVTQWVQGDALDIIKSWTSITHRYWRFKITSPASAPQIAELFLTQTYEFERNPSRPLAKIEEQLNVKNETTVSGNDRFITLGSAKRAREYRIPRILETQKTALLTFTDTWQGINPFWLYDHAGTWIYGKLTSPLNITEIQYQVYSVDFSFLEVLP